MTSGAGWGLALFAALGPTILVGMFGLVRWMAGLWRGRVELEHKRADEAEEELTAISKELRDKTQELADVKVEKMFLERDVVRLDAELQAQRKEWQHEAREKDNL